MHLRPVLIAEADEPTKQIYQAILQIFSLSSVPVIFQYIANFPDFFAYIWEKSERNIHTDFFIRLVHQLDSECLSSVQEIYIPNNQMNSFIKELSTHEQQYLQETTMAVLRANAMLLIVTIGMRESIKGVFVGQQKLSQVMREYSHEELSDDLALFNQKLHSEKSINIPKQNLSQTGSALMPFFTQGLSISHLPQFFQFVDHEMKRLLQTERYLEKRVFLEQQITLAVQNLPFSLGASYQELLRLAGRKPYFHELLYLLVETFPTAYPRLLFTTSMMRVLLMGKNSQSTISRT